MTIQYCSDLHLEFRENKQYLNDNPLVPIGDILLLAGDIVPFAFMDKHTSFFDFLSDHFEATYWVPGNHEYYHSDLSERDGTFRESIRSNVWLLNNVSMDHQKVRFIFSTLWSQIDPANQWYIQQSMADFQVIKFKGKPFTPFDFTQQHLMSKAFLKEELTQSKEKTIVVTHHVPTLLNYPEKYRGDKLNEAFASEQFDLIETSGADYWIFGHHHQAVPAFEIGSTTLLCNQLGYVKYKEHAQFSSKSIIYV